MTPGGGSPWDVSRAHRHRSPKGREHRVDQPTKRSCSLCVLAMIAAKANSNGGDAGTDDLSALARCATGGVLSSMLTGELDRLTKDNERLRALVSSQESLITDQRKELVAAKQADEAVVDALKKELAEERRSSKRAHAEVRRLASQESAARKSARGIAYSAILATVPVMPHDRVLVRYTNPKDLVAVGSVQPRYHDENPTGVNIRASVHDRDGEIMEAVVCADCVTPNAAWTAVTGTTTFFTAATGAGAFAAASSTGGFTMAAIMLPTWYTKATTAMTPRHTKPRRPVSMVPIASTVELPAESDMDASLGCNRTGAFFQTESADRVRARLLSFDPVPPVMSPLGVFV